ncbi:MAG: sodium-dependent bicarbonate transport family permease [Pirellulales bacterium]|nr:sodium-dependent bicarbonate transport family permease [Pirellulales bacterium]
MEILESFWENFRHNLFKPLLLFFYMGFLVPILRVEFEFPYVIYQGLTIYLLVSIGWHGGEELAKIFDPTVVAAEGASADPHLISHAAGFMVVGFITNFIIGCIAYFMLRGATRLRRIDCATVAGYYGSDSAGTFVTCLGVLTAGTIVNGVHMAIPYEKYMPVMLAVMEVPGCLVALFLVSRLRIKGMDRLGNMPDEPGYNPTVAVPVADRHGHHGSHTTDSQAVELEKEMALERLEHDDGNGNGNGNGNGTPPKPPGIFSPKLLHEVFLNPGLFLLFGGILIGFASRYQGEEVSKVDDPLFNNLFQGMLCLFLLEMGMTASKRLRDLKTAGWPFIAFGILAPNIFATLGMCVCHLYGSLIGYQFQLGTYALFAVLCAAASYIAVPAVQRLAIPEASPTLPLAASLGLTFSYNVTIGIPVYLEIAKLLISKFPITAA